MTIDKSKRDITWSKNLDEVFNTNLKKFIIV